MSSIKITKQDYQLQEVVVGHDSGVLKVVMASGDIELIYVQRGDALAQLRSFKNPSEVRFIGGQVTMNKIKALQLDWPPFKREVLVQKDTAVILDRRQGKVQFANKKVSSLAKAKKRVLIVDDSSIFQKIMTKIVESSPNLEVMGVADRPSVAQAIIEKDRPDIITLDIHMPEMTGVDFLKSYLGDKKIPTIVFSAISLKSWGHRLYAKTRFEKLCRDSKSGARKTGLLGWL